MILCKSSKNGGFVFVYVYFTAVGTKMEQNETYM